MTLLYSIIAATVVSLVSLAGIGLIIMKIKNIHQITHLMVSFAVGGLLGDALIHLIPESFENIKPPFLASLLVIAGILVFFSMEKILRWRHCHDPECQNDDSDSHVTTLNQIGDTVHNFVDGMVIYASFIVDYRLGIATFIAVLLHEIPQEIGDFGILIHHGFSPIKAIKANLTSASFAILGVISLWAIGGQNIDISNYLLPITAGGFLYLAASDLIPELHRHQAKVSSSLGQLFFILLGVALMLLLLLLD